MNSIHLIPAPWSGRPNSIADLQRAINTGMEFTVSDISSPWVGSTTTSKELKEQGVTRAQIRYGKRLEKVWIGEL